VKRSSNRKKKKKKMAMNPQQFANAMEAHDRLRKSTEIPLFYGDSKKDTILPSVLLERVERARRSAGWNEERTCDEFLACLREKAIIWHKGFDGVQVNDRVWQEVRDYFLASYEPKFSARTTCTNFQDLRQMHGEKVQEFYDRCALVFRRLCESQPANLRNVRRVPAPAPIVPAADADAAALAAAAAHNANAMTPEQNRAADKLEGMRDAEWFFMRQLFIAGLRDSVRSEVMKAGHEGLRETLSAARETETVLEDVEKKAKHITAVSQEEDETESPFERELADEELEAINAIRKRNGKPPFRRRPPFRRNGGNQNRSRTNLTCRFCKKSGHLQKDCHTRIRSGAPMVDAQGKPYRKVNQLEMGEEDEPDNGAADSSDNSVAKLVNTLNW
jgi:hypothetical protein